MREFLTLRQISRPKDPTNFYASSLMRFSLLSTPQPDQKRSSAFFLSTLRRTKTADAYVRMRKKEAPTMFVAFPANVIFKKVKENNSLYLKAL